MPNVRRLFVLAAGVLLGACAQLATGVNPSAMMGDDGEIARRLTEQELKQELSGSTVKAIVRVGLEDLSTPEQFNRDGTYIRYADNAEIEGHYTIRDGMVCVNVVIHPEHCRFVLVDKTGKFYTSSSKFPTRLHPVTIRR